MDKQGLPVRGRSGEVLLFDRKLAHLSSELQRSLPIVDSRGSFEDLDYSARAIDLEHLATPQRAIAQPDLHNLGIFWLLFLAITSEFRDFPSQQAVLENRFRLRHRTDDRHRILSMGSP